MKPRKWVIIFGLFALMCGASLYYILYISERDDRVKKALASRLAVALGSDISIGEMSLGFLAIHARDVRLFSAQRWGQLTIEDIKIGISLVRLIKNKGVIHRSVNKIIFNRPSVLLHMSSESGSRPPASLPAFDDIVLTRLPVQHIIVRKGLVRIAGLSRDTITLGDGLDGRIWEDKDGLNFELKGRMVSSRRNLSLGGILTKNGARHHLSLRLDRARTARSFDCGPLLVTGGLVDIGLEMSLVSFADISSIEAIGWVSVIDGECRIGNTDTPVKNIHLSVDFLGSELRLSALRWKWGDLEFTGDGNWSWGTKKKHGDILIHIPDLISLFDKAKFPRSAYVRPRERVSAFVHVHRDASSDVSARIAAAAKVAPTGRKPGGGADTLARLQAHIEQRKLIVDSVRLSYGRFRGYASGVADFGRKPPVWSFTYRLAADTVYWATFGQSAVRAHGRVHGIGKKPNHRIEVHLNNPRILGRETDALRADVNLRPDGTYRIATPSSASQPLRVHGSLEASAGGEGALRCTVLVDGSMLRNYAAHTHASLRRISGLMKNASVIVNGTVRNPSLRATVNFLGDETNGAVDLSMRRIRGSKRFVCILRDRDLTAGGRRLALYAHGIAGRGGVTIDSMSLASAVQGAGHFGFNAGDTSYLEFHVRDLSVENLCAWAGARLDTAVGGRLNGVAQLNGSRESLRFHSFLRLSDGNLFGIDNLKAQCTFDVKGTEFSIEPFEVSRAGTAVASLDSCLVTPTGIYLDARILGVPPAPLFGTAKSTGFATAPVEGVVTARPEDSGIQAVLHASFLRFSRTRLDSVFAVIRTDSNGITLKRVTAREPAGTVIAGHGYMPWRLLLGRGADTSFVPRPYVELSASGNILGSSVQWLGTKSAGAGNGTILVRANTNGSQWKIQSVRASLKNGTLLLRPATLDSIGNVAINIAVDSSGKAHIYATGRLRKRRIKLYSSHTVPRGYEPLSIGQIELGLLHLETPDGAIPVHLPGFMEPRTTVHIECRGKEPFSAFTLSGPLDHFRITGTWILRNTEFTYPLLKREGGGGGMNWFKYITWDLDLKPGNRNVMYYFDIGTRPRILRFVEGYVDQGSSLGIRGRWKDRTFHLKGAIRSYRGSVFYGRAFNRNFEVGLEFQGGKKTPGGKHDLVPVMWGKAEALSDTTRFERITLRLMIRDPQTGALSEKGRFTGFGDAVFDVSSPFDEMPGEADRRFYREAGLQFSTLERAGQFVSNFGEQYFHRYVLQRWERDLARIMWLDVINVESSIASNYFNRLYNRQFAGLIEELDYLALANVGVTFGRYFYRDNLFLKARGELIPFRDALTPEYSIGFEFQPMRYFLMDVNYGVYQTERSLKHNPKIQMELQLPLRRVRKLFEF